MPKLLIVDDEIDIREFAKNFFKKRNISVLTASNGVEAVDIIKNERPDLVLLDIRMDEMTGLDVLRKLRSEKDPTRIIMVTGVEDESVITESNSLGILGYIHKPLVLDELEKVVLKELKELAV